MADEPLGARERRSLSWRLAEFSELIERVPDGTTRLTEQVAVPYNEFGIVRGVELIERVIGSVASEYAWHGPLRNEHHIMHPHNRYRVVSHASPHHDSSTVKATFRGNPSLRVLIPRELHDYLHLVAELPHMPPLDVMRQYNLEQSQVTSLYNLIRRTRCDDWYTDERARQKRYSAFLRVLDKLPDGEVGLLPDRARLATLSHTAQRRVLGALAIPRILMPPRVSLPMEGPEQMDEVS